MSRLPWEVFGALRAPASPGEMMDTGFEPLKQSYWNLVYPGRVQDSEVITMFGIPHGISSALKRALHVALRIGPY